MFKLNKFLLHFTEHHAADKSLNVFEFIYMHYLGDDQNANDQEKDMELPFKKMDAPFSFEIASFPKPEFIAQNKLEIVDSYLFVLFRRNQSKDPFLESLFRPPCLA